MKLNFQRTINLYDLEKDTHISFNYLKVIEIYIIGKTI
jgi:hypothetical protein